MPPVGPRVHESYVLKSPFGHRSHWKPSMRTIYKTMPLMCPLYFWQRLTRERACSPGCDCSLRETSLRIAQWRSGNHIDYLQADDISRRLTKTSQFCDVQWCRKTHFASSVMERLINYCYFYNLKLFCTLKTCTQFIPRVGQSAQTYYITLHYITLHYITLHYYGILQLALYISNFH